MNYHECAAILSVFGDETEVHRFKLPKFLEPGFYRATTSYEASKTYWSKLSGQGKTDRMPKSLRFRIFEPNDVMPTSQLIKSYESRGLKIVEHETIWDMYKAIEFDYKRRKWIEN